MFDQFHANEVLPKGMLAYFVTLIPKISSPLDLKDYRPISLLGCLYKLLSKVLARRLAVVMNSIISQSQSAFFKGRHLVDGVLVVNELVDYAKKSKEECLIFKVDFEKAYDSVDWVFLEYMMHRVGMCDRWVAWMKACVFGGSMSILVNGSPTEEICIHRGLKQGDHLAPFLFLLVAEGFSGLMRNAVEANLFEGFRFGDSELVVSHLQYFDDTLCIGKATVQNLWTMKAILRGFEMASGLKINFSKSSLIGVNVGEDFMDMACSFLNCSAGCIPLGSMATWEPLVECLGGRLKSWGHRYISFGGRIILLNLVLSSFPIFYLSFLKLPNQVWKRIVRIQREFLWGGVGGGKKISWVKWESVCHQKRNGGLGVKDLQLMNISLLAKWRWRWLDGVRALWKRVIQSKYGARNASLWWKELLKLGDYGGINWFSSEVGNGLTSRFWNDRWIGDKCFRLKYPRLYSISSHKDAFVAEVGVVTEVGLNWSFRWKRHLFMWEEELLISLKEDLEGVVFSREKDGWWWNLEEKGNFTVKLAYVKLEGLVLGDVLWQVEERRVLEELWKIPTPSKVVAFAWKALLNRIPTKLNLAVRNVLPPGDSVLCGLKEESPLHLFLHCDWARAVWLRLMWWVDGGFITPPNLFIHWACWGNFVGSKTIKKGRGLIWLATLWVLWKVRNDKIFNGVIFEVDDIVEEVKVLSWRWLLSRTNTPVCLFYEWCWDPILCLRIQSRFWFCFSCFGGCP